MREQSNQFWDGIADLPGIQHRVGEFRWASMIDLDGLIERGPKLIVGCTSPVTDLECFPFKIGAVVNILG